MSGVITLLVFTSTFIRALLRAKSINNVKGKENDNLTLGYITHLVIRIDSVACLENDPAP
jgi:ribosomal protein S17E